MGWSKYDTSSSSLHQYSSFRSVETDFIRLASRADGTGFVVYDGKVYYNEVGIQAAKHDCEKAISFMGIYHYSVGSCDYFNMAVINFHSRHL